MPTRRLTYRQAFKHFQSHVAPSKRGYRHIGQGGFHDVYEYTSRDGQKHVLKFKTNSSASQSGRPDYDTLDNSLLCRHTLKTDQQIAIFQMVYPEYASSCGRASQDVEIQGEIYRIKGLSMPYFPDKSTDQIAAETNIALFQEFGIMITDGTPPNFQLDHSGSRGICIDFDHTLCTEDSPAKPYCPRSKERWALLQKGYHQRYWPSHYPRSPISVACARALAAIIGSGVLRHDIPETLLNTHSLRDFDRTFLRQQSPYSNSKMLRFLALNTGLKTEIESLSAGFRFSALVYLRQMEYRHTIPALKGLLSVSAHLDMGAFIATNPALAKSVIHKPPVFHILGTASHLPDFPSLCTEAQLSQCDQMDNTTAVAVAKFVQGCTGEQITVARIRAFFHHPIPIAYNFLVNTDWPLFTRRQMLSLLDNVTDAPGFAYNAASHFIDFAIDRALASCDKHEKSTKRKIIQCVQAECNRQSANLQGLRRAFYFLVRVISAPTKAYRSRQCNYREPNEYQDAKAPLNDAASVLFSADTGSRTFPFYAVTRTKDHKITQVHPDLVTYGCFKAITKKPKSVWQSRLPRPDECSTKSHCF